MVTKDYSRVGGDLASFRIREGTMDEAILSEVKQYAVLPLLNRRVLDIGGNIGGFAVMAFTLGVGSVVSFEPDPENYRILCENIARPGLGRLDAINAAVVLDAPTFGDKISLYVAHGKNMGSHTLYPRRGRDAIDVNYVLWDEVLQMNADTIKMDAEGVEHELLLERDLPDTIEQIVFELHLNRRDWKEQSGPAILEKFRGWRALRDPVIGEKTKQALCAYVRR